ncbi:MAG TPA: elongation factor G [Candidatus Scatomorpha pullistercoris]|uniref:Elongation factor G n=1 Tax=Candidatus Scatomorpha pullistercoris TaxID=2840929 RepID=A0A9D1G5B9_9FIRM|nr:elongation factor G [Candidatus Scatomorpha pullistercoris]
MSYATKDIRNIALLGHGGNGKTSLAESILFLTGATDRLGSSAAGNSVSDYDPEEIRRQISISASTMYTDYQKTKINIIDTPGYFDFAGEVAQALRVADIGIICVSAKDGLNVGAEKAWKALSDANLPRAIYISKVDEEHADFYKAFEQLREKFGPSLSPMSAPIMEGTKVTGLVDILARKAYKYEGKKRTEIPMPADMSDRVEEMYNEIAENAAGTSEELMDKYLETMELSAEEIYGALGTGIAECEITPVFCGSAATGLGTVVLLDAIKNFFPYPREGGKLVDENGPAKAIVYKTISDQFGKFSLFKVISGKVTPDMTLVNARSGAQEKLGHIYYMQGKKNVEVQEIGCGDIGAVSKLSDTKTGDTLCDGKAVEAAPGIEYAVPCYSMAIAPKTKGQEDKVAQGLARLGEEDRSFTITNNAETKQMVIAGAGDIHLDVLCSKLKNKFGVEVELSPARVPYREKIRKPLKAHGRHKKQSGGHGQFGDVWIEFEPQDEQEDMIFAENVFGGSVPKNFFPAVEKGLRECCTKGVLAGYPMVFLKATLYDGSYHPVDSSEMAFKTAAGLAYKELVNASPVILEPIGLLKVTIPDANMGDIMSDISSKRRGTVMGMNAEGGMQTVEAEVPMAEMSSYAIDLRSMTQGRGSFTLEFSRYNEAPAAVQQKIIDEAKANAEE